jgi:hypothetical protein
MPTVAKRKQCLLRRRNMHTNQLQCTYVFTFVLIYYVLKDIYTWIQTLSDCQFCVLIETLSHRQISDAATVVYGLQHQPHSTEYLLCLLGWVQCISRHNLCKASPSLHDNTRQQHTIYCSTARPVAVGKHFEGTFRTMKHNDRPSWLNEWAWMCVLPIATRPYLHRD